MIINQKNGSLILQPMTVEQLALELKKPVSAIILILLKEGIVASKNKVLPESAVSLVAKAYGIDTVMQPQGENRTAEKLNRSSGGAGSIGRLPIVVVVGHVDHGKTTLLDFIRKTRVASKEKGGITQHIGAYKATTRQGAVVFLDTPGHEAFSMMRARGITVADIAILIVAADDGVMPQTIEALERAKLSNLPVVVAVNKVDKANAKQIESIKTELSRYDLVPEDWGGQTPYVAISALTGQGIDDLLDVVVLQSQMMELSADFQAPASGYVLESHLEKGRGPVATIICQQGILRVGDSFTCGTMRGRVSSLKDSLGKSVQSIDPSHPAQVAGFNSLARAGDIFQVCSARESKKVKTHSHDASDRSSMQQVIREGAVNIIVKTDTVSSGEALIEAIKKVSEKAYSSVYIVNFGVGSINESDLALAHNTKSLVYGLHVKLESSALSQAQRLGVKIKLFDVIYKLLEELKEHADSGRPIKMKKEKIGEALVLKVFDIKNLGIVAGSRVTEGYCSRLGSVVVYRGKKRIAEGKITSLQKEKNPAKEVRKGFECAFMIESFQDWQVDDRVECFLEMPE